MPKDRSPARRFAWIAGAAAVAALLAWLGLRGGGSDPGAVGLEERVARERAAAFFRLDRIGEARTALAPVLADERASVAVVLDGAAVELAAGDYPAADRLLDRAEQRDPRSPRLAYLRGQRAREFGEFTAALPWFEAAHAALPDDLATRLGLAEVLAGLGRVEEAKEHYREIVALGPELGGSWYVSAVYRLARLLVEDGREAEAERYFTVLEEAARNGFEPPTATQVSRGELGVVLVPPPAGEPNATPEPPRFATEGVRLASFVGARELLAVDLDEDGDADLAAATASGIVVALNAPEDGRETAIAGTAGAEHLRAIDFDNDGDFDLAYTNVGRAQFLLAGDGAWSEVMLTVPEHGAIVDWTPVDWDHDGDVDLALVLADGGARLWRNDGLAVGAEGRFSDATDESGLAAFVVDARWLRAEDFDGDNDVDLLFGGETAILADSLRRGRFADASARLAGVPARPGPPAVADFDANGRADLAFVDGAVRLFLATADGGWSARTIAEDAPASVPHALDLDLDGAFDLVTGTRAWLAVGSAAPRAVELPAGDAFAAVEFDGDGRLDAAVVRADGAHVLRGEGIARPALRLVLRGVRDNRRALGATVEARAGATYQRRVYDGSPLLLGAGAPRIDVLRITWPNGVIQEDVDLDLAARRSFEIKEPAEFGRYEQSEGLIGSCPFLYTWNGERYEFISDVLGITPLGLPMAPGMLVPPDHDEYVLISGSQLREKNGELLLQITEELREVTYLDRVRLDVVDHVAGVAVYPDERFTFPPFPEPHVHTATRLVAPASARDGNGRDWSAELAQIDDAHAVPFEPYRQQFMGLAPEHTLELVFPADAAHGEKLRLFLTGWLFWTNASINVASARTPGVEFLPPIVQVPDGEGGWRDAGPPIGFPAGKTKTMIVDLSHVLDRADPRLRLRSTLRLYWDRIALCADDDDAALVRHALEPRRAELWERGFSAPLARPAGRHDLPERFDWNVLAPRPRWNPHPGLYTALGECVELLGAIDDRFVILASGDALEIAFDARELPPLEAGMERDYLLFLDGWAKDRDPNTHEALEVEPLPHHGMSGYPYDASTPFPDTPAHREWRATWNRRPAARLVRPLAPAEEARWLLDG